MSKKYFTETDTENRPILKTQDQYHQKDNQFSGLLKNIFLSFLGGSIIGNRIDRLVENERNKARLLFIFNGKIEENEVSEEFQIDIDWHYLFYVQIYSLLEYDQITRQNPLCSKSYQKYLLHIKDIRSQNNQAIMKSNNGRNDNNAFLFQSHFSFINSILSDIYKSNTSSNQIFPPEGSKNLKLKQIIPKIIPIVLLFSQTSLQEPIQKVYAFLNELKMNEQLTAGALFYFVVMNKLLKYFLKAKQQTNQTISLIRKRLIQKKYKNYNALNELFQQLKKNLDGLQKFVSFYEKIPKELEDQKANEFITNTIEWILKLNPLKSESEFIVNVVTLVIYLFPSFSKLKILEHLTKLSYERSTIPTYLLALPFFAVFGGDKQNEQHEDIQHPNCILNQSLSSQYFSSEISSQIFTQFINMYSPDFYSKLQ